jgi:hypothetical protein
MEDAAPELYASLKKEYERNVETNRRIGTLEGKLENGGTYQAAEEYSYEIGEALSKAFADGLSSEVLPDGHMYYNIAVRTVDPLIREAWGEAAAAAVKAQENINGAAGLRIRAKQAEFNEDRLHQLINVLTQDGVPYDEVSGILEGKTTNVIQSAVDDTLKTNADFQARAGLSPKIVRIADPKCCEWCQSLEGEYPYPAPKEIYQRHANCECVVDFHAANGRVQNIHTREWREEQRAAEVEERKRREQELNNESLWMQEYRQTTRSNEVVNDVKFQDVELRRAVEYDHEIYLSENVTIKPRALHELDVQLSEAMRRYRGNSENRPKLAVLTSAEIGQNRVALYEPTNNTIYVIPEVGDRRRILDFQKDMACGDNPNATMYHEVWHWMQAEGYRERIGDITTENRGEYMRTIAEYAKKRLDAVGVNEYNVLEISDYAARKYSNGRFDETEAELHVRKALG